MDKILLLTISFLCLPMLAPVSLQIQQQLSSYRCSYDV